MINWLSHRDALILAEFKEKTTLTPPLTSLRVLSVSFLGPCLIETPLSSVFPHGSEVPDPGLLLPWGFLEADPQEWAGELDSPW